MHCWWIFWWIWLLLHLCCGHVIREFYPVRVTARDKPFNSSAVWNGHWSMCLDPFELANFLGYHVQLAHYWPWRSRSDSRRRGWLLCRPLFHIEHLSDQLGVAGPSRPASCICLAPKACQHSRAASSSAQPPVFFHPAQHQTCRTKKTLPISACTIWVVQLAILNLSQLLKLANYVCFNVWTHSRGTPKPRAAQVWDPSSKSTRWAQQGTIHNTANSCATCIVCTCKWRPHNKMTILINALPKQFQCSFLISSNQIASSDLACLVDLFYFKCRANHCKSVPFLAVSSYTMYMRKHVKSKSGRQKETNFWLHNYP